MTEEKKELTEEEKAEAIGSVIEDDWKIYLTDEESEQLDALETILKYETDLENKLKYEDMIEGLKKIGLQKLMEVEKEMKEEEKKGKTMEEDWFNQSLMWLDKVLELKPDDIYALKAKASILKGLGKMKEKRGRNCWWRR